MSQKIFLTSCIAMGVIAPAFAEPTNTGTFPSDGYMQEDYTYTNAATAENMDTVYEGTVNANAEYTDILYNIVAGNYLEAGSDATNGTQCPAGSWCPGLTDALYNATDDQGINTCPSEYGLSAAGSSSQNDCYRTCTNADVEHSTGTMNGGYYYGNNNQCEPTGCVAGWHRKPGLNVATAIGNTSGLNSAYISNSGSFGQYPESHLDAAYYGLSTSDHNSFAVSYGTKGKIHGHGRCSTQSGSTGSKINDTYPDITTFASLTDETGQEGAQYCYCNLDGYTPAGGTMQSLSSSWVFRDDFGDASQCASSCAANCASILWAAASYLRVWRAAVFGAVVPTLASCEANTITINWSDASAADISANNAGTATYGSDVRTPVKAQTIKGKTFKGWRFSKPETTNLPE